MASSDEFGALTRAFTGLGVDENSIITVLGKWHPGQRQSFRQNNREIFIEDERKFERWDDGFVQKLHQEFLRFKEAVVLWTMHPWERDARLLRDALFDGPHHGVLIEIACTRSSEELLGARRAYHSLFDHSIEEDIAFHINSTEKNLLVGLVTSYRYEGPKFSEEIAKSEAKFLHSAVKDSASDLLEVDEIVRILSTRSKLHLESVYKHYKDAQGTYVDEDLVDNTAIQQTIQCLCKPQTYFSQVLHKSLETDADEISKGAISRVIVTQADSNIKAIQEEYLDKYGVTVFEAIKERANGTYKDFLLTLLARGD